MYERLRSAHPNMTVYKKQDIPERFHIKHHYRVPPLYLLADEGYAIAWVSRSMYIVWASGMGNQTLTLIVILTI